ncbi:MAG TPA: hypothetical protein VFB69_04315 [Candidatus Dormibacteraeota bacterium]|nr:hypothetical protein [Candidatus Dormibacteraeota bacterium]
MSHLWQRFLLACALVVGLAVGVGATVFGYSNLETVDLHWSVLRLDGVPLWAVAIVPVALVIVAGTVYHWIDGLHHFSEHMRHRHRVRDLEAEITRLREHLDHVLEMPRGDMKTPQPAIAEGIEESPAATDTPSLPPAAGADTASELAPELEPEQEPVAAAADETPAVADAEPEKKSSSDRRKRSRIIMETEPAPAQTNGAEAEQEAEPALKEG